jgi:hypothetical protein
VDLLIQGEFGWDPEAGPWHNGASAGAPNKNADWMVNVWMFYMGMGQNLVPLVNIKIAGKWMFIPLKMVCIGIDA